MRGRNARRRRIVVGAFVALALASISVFATLGGAGSGSSELLPVDGAQSAEVIGVIDGDTLDVRAGGAEFRVRLFGIDTPERDEACYSDARDRLEELAGDEVQLVADERTVDPFGRELRYVYTSEGALIDEQLAREGYGYAWTEGGRFQSQIVAAESEARDAGQGCLWD